MVTPILSAIDVDGTLVGPDKTISAVNADQIERYRACGGQILLASGRMHSSIMRYARELNLPAEDLIISYNGAMAKTVAGALLFERPVPREQAAIIVEYCRVNNLHLNYYADDVLYVRELNAESELYEVRSGSPSVPIGDLSQMLNILPTKLLIIDHPERLDPLVSKFREQFGDTLYITKTDDEYLEFMAAGVNKGSGLRDVAASLNIPQSEVAAFGDSFNDVEMLQWAGYGVAMSNGRVEAQRAARIIADNATSSAVGNTLKGFVRP